MEDKNPLIAPSYNKTSEERGLVALVGIGCLILGFLVVVIHWWIS